GLVDRAGDLSGRLERPLELELDAVGDPVRARAEGLLELCSSEEIAQAGEIGFDGANRHARAPEQGEPRLWYAGRQTQDGRKALIADRVCPERQHGGQF